MACAAGIFSSNVNRATQEDEVSYIPCEGAESVSFFSREFIMDENWTENVGSLPPTDEFETTLYKSAVKDIEGNINLV